MRFLEVEVQVGKKTHALQFHEVGKFADCERLASTELQVDEANSNKKYTNFVGNKYSRVGQISNLALRKRR